MTGIKHGRYDQAKHLPNNTGQPCESGLYVWLVDQVRQLSGGEPLIAECYNHDNDKYQWLLEQIAPLPGAPGIIAEYYAKRKYLASEARQRQRIRTLKGFEKQLEETGHEHYEKKANRIRKEIAKAQERWKFPTLE